MANGHVPHVVVAGHLPVLGSDEEVCERLRSVGFTVSHATTLARAERRIVDDRADVVVVAGGTEAEGLVATACDRGVPCCIVGDEVPASADEATVAYPPTGPKPIAGLIGVVHELAADVDGAGSGAEPSEVMSTPVEGAGGTELSTARVLDEAPVGVTISDVRQPDEPLVYVNDQFVEQTGYDREAAIGRNCRFLQGPATEEEPVARMRAAIDAGESVSVELRNYDRSGELFWQEVSIAPIRNEAGVVTHYAGFQADVTRRKRAERAAKRHRAALTAEHESLRTLLHRLDGVVEQITGAVVTAESRAALGEAVCSRLGTAYAAAWLGTYDPAEEWVEPEWTAVSTLADDPGETLGPVPLEEGSSAASTDGGTAVDGTDAAARPEPALLAEAVENRAVAVADDIGWGTDVSGVAAVPVTYRSTVFGLFCVYTDEDAPFGREEPAVLSSIGRTVGIGLNAIDSRSSLTTDRGFEVEFAVGASSLPLRRLADGAGCALKQVGLVPDGDGRTVLCTTEGATAAELRDAADDTAGIHAVTCVAERESAPLFAFGLRDLPLIEAVGEHGLELADLRVDGSGVTVVARGARETAARSLVETVEAAYGSVDVRRFGEQPTRKTTTTEFVADLEERLTDRQRRALTTAVAAGYFEWPRDTDGDELAEAFGVARSTFHQHLRAALRKLVEAFAEAAEPDGWRP